MIEPPGSTYWHDWDHYVRRGLLDRGLISPADLDLYKIVESWEEAVEEVSHFYRNFHSIRYIEGKLVVRVQHAPGEDLLDTLNQDFSDILVSGSIATCDPHPYEADEPEMASLHRLKMHFDQKHLGRLRLMIDVLNDSVSTDQASTHPSITPVHWITPEAGDDDVDEP